MIVAYNALSLRPGVFDGAATYTLNLLHHLPHALPEAKIVVLVRQGEDRVSPADRLDVRIIRVHGALGRIAFESLLAARTLRRVGADVFLSPNESIPFGLGRPVVVVAQNLVYHRDGPVGFRGAGPFARLTTRLQALYYRRRMAHAYRRAAAVVAVSHETARVLAERAGLPLEKTTVVHEGADSICLPEAMDGLDREDRLLVVSSLAPYKNLEQTLEVYAGLLLERPTLELTFAGADWRGYRTVLERRARRLGLPMLRVEEGVDPSRLVHLYSTSRILIHLSSCESFGLPIVEAMRYGLPVVAANRSSLPEVAAGAARLVDPDDIRGTVAAIARLLDSESERHALGAAGRRRADSLRWRNTAETIAAVVRSLAER